MFPLMPTRSNSSTSSPSSSASSPTPSLSPSGWNPTRPTISPPTVAPVTPSEDAGLAEYFTAPGSTTSSRTCRLYAPFLSPLQLSGTPHHHCAYPSWPAGPCLASDVTSSPTSYVAAFDDAPLPSSRISDEDLESLDLSSAPSSRRSSNEDEPFLGGDSAAAAAAGLGISWSDVGGGNVPAAARVPDRPRRRLPPPPVLRRRSSSRGVKRKSRSTTLGVIAE